MNIAILAALLGSWSFFGFIYRGEEMAPINPKLHIEMSFRADGENSLVYWREDEEGLCERKAKYEISDCSPDGDFQSCQLYQKVIWLNPKNRSDCSKDPDMQMDKESWSAISVSKEEFQLNAPLGSESLTFRFARPPEEEMAFSSAQP